MSWIITGKEAGSLGLLDQYGGAAAAYSLRNLSLYYTDPVVRVRRDNDDAEQDFTATEVSDGTLAAWVGAGNNGFVRTWYDQSGNNYHATQTAQSSQPQIASNGLLLTKNAKPTINFDGTNDFLSNTTAINQQITLFVACSTDVTPSPVPTVLFDGNNNLTSRNVLFVLNSTRKVSMFAGTTTISSATSPAVDALFLAYGLFNATQSEVAFNGLTSTIGNAGSQTLSLGWRIGAEGALTLSYQWNGNISECIFWVSDRSANRTAIEANINAHYSIY